MAHRHAKKLDEETTYWLSYSDMMAALLLVFVLIITFTVLHAKVQYDEKQHELVGKEQELMIQSKELEDERANAIVQQSLLDEQAKTMKKQEEELEDAALTLAEQEEALRQQHILLDELQSLMEEQQEQLDNIIGVRSELIQALKKEFEKSGLNIEVDEQTGSIAFDSSIMFQYNQDELKDAGKEFLDEFLPRYVKILLGGRYQKYISEIIIEGHTDTKGNYLFNLELSQKRAFSVAEYCLSDDSDVLTKAQKEKLESVLSTNGKSYSKPVLDEDGEVDMEASRRVEFLFRLKDEEMITQMMEILKSESENQE